MNDAIPPSVRSAGVPIPPVDERAVRLAHIIVVGALLRDDRVLLGHRRADRRDFPDCWALPGGHVEPGEAPIDALIRELHEELGIEPAAYGAPAFHLERHPERQDGMTQDAWIITAWVGEPTNLAKDEHDELRWITAKELPHLPLAHPEHLAFLVGLLTG